MNRRSQEAIETIVVFMLILGVFLVTVTDLSAAPAGGQSIEERVTTNQWFCEFTGGSFNTVGVTAPGRQPGTFDHMAVSTCNYGGGDYTTCTDTATTHTCEDSEKSPPGGRGDTTQPEDATQTNTYYPSGNQLPTAALPVTIIG
jgi:hypothetical protein